jgi:hypothetical protein
MASKSLPVANQPYPFLRSVLEIIYSLPSEIVKRVNTQKAGTVIDCAPILLSRMTVSPKTLDTTVSPYYVEENYSFRNCLVKPGCARKQPGWFHFSPKGIPIE